MGQQVGIKGDVIPISAHPLNNASCGWEGRCLASRHSTLPPLQHRRVVLPVPVPVPVPVPMPGAQELPSHPRPAEGGEGGEQLPSASCSTMFQLGILSSPARVWMGILMGTLKTITFSPHQYAKSSCHFSLFITALAGELPLALHIIFGQIALTDA